MASRRAFVLLALALAGCAAPAGLAPSPGPLPPAGLACVAPCVREIDHGIRWEPSVAVDPKDPLHLVASSGDQSPDPATGDDASWGMSSVSRDGGVTWSTTRLPGGKAGPPTHPLAKYDLMDDSVVTILPDGTVLWSAIAVVAPSRSVPTSSGGALVLLRSTDGGRTFPDALVVQDGGGVDGPRGVGPVRWGTTNVAYEFHDKQGFALAPDGTVLLAWDVVKGGTPDCPSPLPVDPCTEVLVSTSRDAGRTWSAPGVVVKGGVFSGAFPLVRDDGAWVVSYRDTKKSDFDVAVSTDRGSTWRTSTVDRTTKFPVLARTHAGAVERIYAAYPQSAQGPDGPQNVTVRWSDDGAVTWSAPLRLDASERDGRTIPCIVATADGGAIVTYWHVREKGAELRAVRVRDGAASAPIVLGTTDGTTRDVGDYQGLAPLPDGAFAVWDAQRAGATTLVGARLSS